MPTVIIVEDFDPVREALCALLRPAFACLPVRTAEEALRVLDTLRADVVVTDLKLPGMSGVELLAELMSSRPGLPVIVVTGGAEGLAERDFRELGAFGYLPKPFTAGEVERLVRGAVESVRAGRQRAAAPRRRQGQ